MPGVKTTDPKTNGCPDPDRDKDGINERATTRAPTSPARSDPDPKKNGCPKAFVQAGQIKIIEQVKFKTASAQILPGKDSEDVLQAVLEGADRAPGDQEGPRRGPHRQRRRQRYNKTLSQRARRRW